MDLAHRSFVTGALAALTITAVVVAILAVRRGSSEVDPQPTATVPSQSAGLASYCRHATETKALYDSLASNRYTTAAASRRATALEESLVADAGILTEEDRFDEAAKVYDHAAGMKLLIEALNEPSIAEGGELLFEYGKKAAPAQQMCSE